MNAEPDTILLAAEAECDIISPTALDLQDVIYLTENGQNSKFSLEAFQPSEIEMLAIGITPYAYDDYYYPYGVDRPDIFEDSRTRQAIAYCMDRETIINKLLGGAAEVTDSILRADHPLLDGVSLTPYPFDPTLGISLLEQVGWNDLDINPDTPLTAVNVFNVPQGTEFEIGLLISESPLRGEIAAEIAAGLANCGIKVNISQVPASELYQPGPDGLIFGRQFDLALLSWQTSGRFNCNLFTTSEIPTDANYWMGEKTGGANYYGFSNPSYDETCALGTQGGLDTDASVQAARNALQILNNELPFIPVYLHPASFLKSAAVCGFIGNIGQENEFLMDIEYLRTGEACAAAE
jgi:peptide/nickel transport system substrate-binding protein